MRSKTYNVTVVYKDNLPASTQEVVEAVTPQEAFANVLETTVEEMVTSKIVLDVAEEGNMWIHDHEDQMIIIQLLN